MRTTRYYSRLGAKLSLGVFGERREERVVRNEGARNAALVPDLPCEGLGSAGVPRAEPRLRASPSPWASPVKDL